MYPRRLNLLGALPLKLLDSTTKMLSVSWSFNISINASTILTSVVAPVSGPIKVQRLGFTTTLHLGGNATPPRRSIALATASRIFPSDSLTIETVLLDISQTRHIQVIAVLTLICHIQSKSFIKIHIVRPPSQVLFVHAKLFKIVFQYLIGAEVSNHPATDLRHICSILCVRSSRL